ncbi:hypothetical protein ABZT04_23915 [Streptomyces sp. NPDC005492]|uniref:hypothetical protein n=1 Tax=Streptomyces sp. NPDC005492 TaxID=3156883 RepID=UPI0033BB4E16
MPSIESEIRGPKRPHVRAPSARPPTPVRAPTESERIAREKQRLTMIRKHWNQLCGIVHIWHGSEGYDRDRWRRVSFLDAAAEAGYHRARGRAVVVTVTGHSQSGTSPSAWP